jgi:hypothetical protein
MADNNTLQDILQWMQNPQRTQQVQQLGGLFNSAINNLQASTQQNRELNAKAFANPNRPLQITDKEAFNQLAQDALSGPAGIAPVGMVVGRGITEAAMARANQMLNSGASEGRIFQETGLVKVPTKEGFKWGRQISDAPISIDFEALKNAPYDATFINRNPSKIEDVISHPELFDLYPELKNLGILKTSDGGGFYRSGSNELGLPSVEFVSPEFMNARMQERNAMAVHELQHAVQNLEQWPRGGNSAEFMGQAHKQVKAQADWAMKSLEDILSSFLDKQGLTPPKDFKSFVQSVQYIQKNGPKYLEDVGPESRKRIEAVLASDKSAEFLDSFNRIENSYKKINEMKNSAGRKYTRLAGEGQANAVEQQYLDQGQKNPVTSYYRYSPENLIYRDPFGDSIK